MPVSAYGSGYDEGMKGLSDLFYRLRKKFDSDEFKQIYNNNSSGGVEDSLPSGTDSIEKMAAYLGHLKYLGSGADEQNKFNLEMDSTKQQRAVADLQAAGYNPLITASGGSGAGVVSSSSGVNTNSPILPGLLNGIAHIVSSSIHAASNDNRTLTMANSAASVNTAKIAADAARKAAQAEYYQNKARDHSKSEFNRAMANYYNKKSSEDNVHYDSKNKKWIDDYWKNFKE